MRSILTPPWFCFAVLLSCSGDLDSDAEQQEEALEPGARSFTTSADARVESTQPDANFGDSSMLRTDTSPEIWTFLRFEIHDLPAGKVKSAKLRLYANNGSADGPSAYATGSSWSESAITWNNRPQPMGPQLGDRARVAKRSWVEYDVTSVVSGNGTVSFLLKEGGLDDVRFASREASTRRPRILVTVEEALVVADGGVPPSPDPVVGVDGDGIRRIYPATTTPAIPAEYGSRHENGDRYSTNHKFENYEVTGYYLTENTEKIEMKTDGPNHSGCDALPRCQWAEPRIDIANGRASISSEWPHPENHPDAPCPSCVTLGRSLSNRWIGYKVIAYASPDGYRVYEQWLDPDGLDANGRPRNNWMLMMREMNTGQVMPSPERALPLEGRGLEAEIRMHGGHGTEMKYGKIQEIVRPSP